MRKTTKKYTTRGGPPYPGNSCCGLTREGNDGLLYVSERRGASKSCRWYPTERKEGKKRSAPKRKSAPKKRKSAGKRKSGAKKRKLSGGKRKSGAKRASGGKRKSGGKRASGAKKSSWNKFRAAHKGEGYTMAELSRLYAAQ